MLALYTGVTLLGHGLHWLSSEKHHHHGLGMAGCATHGPADSHSHCSHHHDATHSPADQACGDQHVGVAASDCVTDAHDCDICTFLLQVRSEPPRVTATVIRPHIVTAAPVDWHCFYSPISVGSHAARGPPLVLA